VFPRPGPETSLPLLGLTGEVKISVAPRGPVLLHPHFKRRVLAQPFAPDSFLYVSPFFRHTASIFSRHRVSLSSFIGGPISFSLPVAPKISLSCVPRDLESPSFSVPTSDSLIGSPSYSKQMGPRVVSPSIRPPPLILTIPVISPPHR